MFLRPEIVRQALDRLHLLHPFFGITYLVCKRGHLPIGHSVSFRINHTEQAFLEEFYKPDPKSEYYFQPFRTSSRVGSWLSPKYPSSGSQSTRTRGHLAKAFLHERNTDLWGWATNYIDVLSAQLAQDKMEGVPAFWLACWLYRYENWAESTLPITLEEKLFADFSIVDDDLRLFERGLDVTTDLLTDDPYSDRSVLQHVEPAPDSSPEEGGTLRLLEITGVGPCPHLNFRPAERLSVITGDNGLGKSFILECAWWSLTGNWTGRSASPSRQDSPKLPSIRFEIASHGTRTGTGAKTINFDFQNYRWPVPKARPTIPGLVVYARVDGSFAVWDPVRSAQVNPEEGRAPALVFSREEVLRGLEGEIEGLLRDWVRWQTSSAHRSTFETFCSQKTFAS